MNTPNDNPTTEAPASMTNLIDRDEMLAVYRSDLKAIQAAKEEKMREYYVLAGKEDALASLIAYHEKTE